MILGAAIVLALAGTAMAAPSGDWRGIIEGSYGRPWDHGQRERVLRWMPSHGFTAYVHAPKEDLYQRTNWRDPYPAGEWREIRAEIRLARRRGVEWIPNLSPALPLIPTPAVPRDPPSLPLCFSCPEGLQAVLDKLEPFRRAGSRTFMVSFDDVIQAFADPRDIARYGLGEAAFGRANGEFLTNLRAALRERNPRARLLTVGKDYSGTAGTEYLEAFEKALAPGIGVMWTGPGVPSQDFSPADAQAYGRQIGRRPIVWDNWSNDDTSGNIVRPLGTVRLFLGPYRRPARTARAVAGFFLNAANESDVGKLPLATAGDYLARAGRYSRRRSWLAAVRELAGSRRRAEALRALAETSYSTKLDPTDAPTFSAFAKRVVAGAGGAGLELEAADSLQRELRLVEEAPRRLAGLAAPLRRDLERLIASARVSARAGSLALGLLRAERPAIEIAESRRGYRLTATAPQAGRVGPLRGRLATARLASTLALPFAYGWKLGIGIDVPPYPVGPNAMTTFLGDVSGLDTGWAPPSSPAVETRMGQKRLRPRPDGSFRVRARACGRRITATDAAGRASIARIPPCR